MENELPAQLPCLVVDKSYAHAVSAKEKGALATRNTILVPSAFYFEVFDAESRKRIAALKGFPEFRRVHLPDLLTEERNSGKPAVHAKLLAHKFSPDVASKDWTPNTDLAKAQARYREVNLKPHIDFWQVIIKKGVIGFSANELLAVSGIELKFTTLCRTLRSLARIRSIAKMLSYPHAEILDQRWLYYRYIQAWILQGLIFQRRFPNPKDAQAASEERIEHDVHDIEYLMLGLHVGRLATNDMSDKIAKASMGWRFELLEPDGELIVRKKS